MHLKGVFYKDLGMAEAVWAIELDHLPLVVGIDAAGGDLFAVVAAGATVRAAALIEGRCGSKGDGSI
jgi:fumarate hydratase subunit beta